MSKRNIQQGILLLCGLAVLAVLAIVTSQYSAYTETKQEWEEAKQRLAEEKLKIVLIKESIEEYENDKKEFEKYLFQERDIPSFLDGIAQYAKRASVNIVDMKTRQFVEVVIPKEITSAQSQSAQQRTAKRMNSKREDASEQNITLAALPIQIQVEGTFQSFVEFLGYLEDFKQLVTVGNVQIVTTKDYPQLKCDFTLKIYSLQTKISEGKVL